jgi:complement component 1 Q subcomponent-binding protein, mitochondrial
MLMRRSIANRCYQILKYNESTRFPYLMSRDGFTGVEMKNQSQSNRFMSSVSSSSIAKGENETSKDHINYMCICIFTVVIFCILVDKRLAALLKEEHRFEAESTEKSPERIYSFLKKYGRNIQDQEHHMEILLKKTLDSEDIVVTFTASQVEEPEPTMEEEEEEKEDSMNKKDQQEQKEEANEEAEEDAMPYSMEETPFSVTIKKQGEQHALLFDCIAVNDSLEIESVRYLPNITLANSRDANVAYDLSDTYGGPVMATLEDELQEVFFEYLEARGIDENLATFINDYTLFKEQKEYIQWLKDVQNFVAKKN